MVRLLSRQENEFKKGLSIIILCAGEGSRMQKHQESLPKPLKKIPYFNNIPIIQHTIKNLKECNIKDITIVAGHKGEQIEDYALKNFKDLKISNLNTYTKSIFSPFDLNEIGIDYRKGPLHSFITFLQMKKFWLISTYNVYIIIPGDTIYDPKIFNPIFRSVKEIFAKINYNPIIFYRKVTGAILKNKHKLSLNSTQKIISTVKLTRDGEELILKSIKKMDLNNINSNKTVFQVIPVFVFTENFLKDIYKEEIIKSMYTFRDLINYSVLNGIKINYAEIDQQFEFYDLDYEIDIKDMENSLKEKKEQ